MRVSEGSIRRGARHIEVRKAGAVFVVFGAVEGVEDRGAAVIEEGLGRSRGGFETVSGEGGAVLDGYGGFLAVFEREEAELDGFVEV